MARAGETSFATGPERRNVIGARHTVPLELAGTYECLRLQDHDHTICYGDSVCAVYHKLHLC
eukprot:1681713-Rhodomonas_salina.1